MPGRAEAGLTLIEMVAVLGILVIVGVLLTSVVGRMHGAGDQAKSTANMRAIYIGLDSYTQDNGYWPQQPKFGRDQQKEYGAWWIRTLQPYDISASTWQCPGVKRLGAITKDGETMLIHYSPTMFDARPRTAYKWSNMPWLVQIGNVFGDGALMVFPDGSVRDLDSVMFDYGQ